MRVETRTIYGSKDAPLEGGFLLCTHSRIMAVNSPIGPMSWLATGSWLIMVTGRGFIAIPVKQTSNLIRNWRVTSMTCMSLLRQCLARPVIIAKILQLGRIDGFSSLPLRAWHLPPPRELAGRDEAVAAGFIRALTQASSVFSSYVWFSHHALELNQEHHQQPVCLRSLGPHWPTL